MGRSLYCIECVQRTSCQSIQCIPSTARPLLRRAAGHNGSFTYVYAIPHGCPASASVPATVRSSNHEPQPQPRPPCVLFVPAGQLPLWKCMQIRTFPLISIDKQEGGAAKWVGLACLLAGKHPTDYNRSQIIDLLFLRVVRCREGMGWRCLVYMHRANLLNSNVGTLLYLGMVYYCVSDWARYAYFFTLICIILRASGNVILFVSNGARYAWLTLAPSSLRML